MLHPDDDASDILLTNLSVMFHRIFTENDFLILGGKLTNLKEFDILQLYAAFKDLI